MLGNLFFRGSDPEILIFPKKTSNGESTRKGLYLAGEAGGLSLLKNSLNSGAKIVSDIAEELTAQSLPEGYLHLLIIGAGPAGLAAGARASKLGLSYLIIEQGVAAQTIQNFHKNKPVFAEPATVVNESDLWFEECSKEELLAKWKGLLDGSELALHTAESFIELKEHNDCKVVITDKGEYCALAVILATGKAGNPRKLKIHGEDLPQIKTSLDDPDYYKGENIAVIGAGDSAAEIALALCQENNVSLIVRRNKIDRPKQRNRDSLYAAARSGKLKLLFKSKPRRITPDNLELETTKGVEYVAADHVFLALGNDLPLPLYRKLGIGLENDWSGARLIKLLAFSLLVILFYLWKSNLLAGYLTPENWGMYSGDALGLYAWTTKLSDLFTFLPPGPSIWAGAVYTGLVAGFGLHCIYKYRNDPFQVKRYCIIIFSQAVLLWLLPEVLFQGILKLADGWRSYGLFLPAPLYVWNFKSPLTANLFWLVWFVVYTFAGVPLIARYTGKKFCSFFCGCGCLAETFGDPWRQLAPRGKRARAWEKLGQWTILALVCSLVTFGIINQQSLAWDVQKLLIDFLLASIIGVATYPFWGGRIWCRFFCPLARVLHFSSGNTCEVKISSGSHCIECGLCSKYCQMGIPVMEFAKSAKSFDNKNSSCIQCGICISVCPVRNLQHGEWDEAEWDDQVNDGALVNME